jgi:NAD(P)-dependent dehydrogenase (short-subunit alcohol dehydrogenase family)
MARSERVHAVAQEIGGTAVQGSVAVPEDLERLVAHTVGLYGRIDALVNNTGHPAKGDPVAITDADWQSGYDLILASVIRLARLVTPIMRVHGSGAVVTISSYAARAPDVSRPVSSVMRAALTAWTRVHAESVAPFGIRVNAVLPGFVESGAHATAIPGGIPMQRMGRLEELAATVAFLLSPEAGYITGQSILMDGGLVKG